MDAKAPISGEERSSRKLASKVVLFLLFAAALLSFSKGLSSISIAGEPYWLVNYGDGLIRRGLIGQLFSTFVDQHELGRVLRAALLVHVSACILLLIGFWSWLRILLNRGSDSILLAIFGIFVTSQFFPTQAFVAGFLDIYLYILVFLAAVAMVRKRYVVAAFIGFIGPFVHEGFIFFWLTLGVLVLWEDLTIGRVLVLLSPLVATAIVYFGSTEAATIAQLAKAPLDENSKKLMLEGQLGRTLGSTLDYMFLGHFKNHFPHLLIAFTIFMPTAAVMMWAYASVRQSWYDKFAFVTASLAPAIIVLFASDLSRLMVLIYFSVLLSILYMQMIRPGGAASRSIVGVCWLVALIGLLSPLVYADFDRAIIVDNGVVPSKDLVVGRAIRPLLYSSKILAPRTP